MKSKTLIWILSSLSLLTVIVTVSLYYYKFGSSNLSEKEQDWVSFADYFSGTVEPILTLLNLIILTYLSIKLTKIEDDRNTWTLQELARPYANLLFENGPSEIDITITNLGLGPMIITDFTLSNASGKTFKNFYELITFIDPIEDSKFNKVNSIVDSFEINSENGGAIGKDQSHYILRLYFKDDNIYNSEYTDVIRKRLNDYTLTVSYSDIYKRPIDCMKEKLIFKPWNQIGSA